MQSQSGSRNWSEANKLYWKNHTELIRILFIIGIKVPSTARLSLFWLRSRLNLVYPDADPGHLQDALALIDELVYERTLGWEPANKNERYI